ncbi:EAL domain-containing protein, partial [Priestia megaterium]|uniref:EAL domain-containing protein n=1 Tax=Priestia megaterium TaxID=1404 RepID=UPI002E2553DF
MLPVSINLSSKHFLKPRFLQHLQQTLPHYNIHPSFIQFQLTQTSIIHYQQHLKKLIHQLKKIPLTFPLHHFPTHFS